MAAKTSRATCSSSTNFFLTSTPTVVCTGSTGGLTATVAFAGTSQFVLTTTTTAWDTTAKVCTFSNVATGAATAGSSSVTVQSALNGVSSPAVASGALYGFSGVTFVMSDAQRKATAQAKEETREIRAQRADDRKIAQQKRAKEKAEKKGGPLIPLLPL